MPFLIHKPLNNLSKVTDEKGNRARHPYTGEPKKPHKGIDLVPGTGEVSLDVFAAHDGKVIFAGQEFAKDKNGKFKLDENGNRILGGYGNYITIESRDGSGRQTLYAHLAEILVRVNQIIVTNNNQPTKIGVAGNTGGSTGVHLHFEVREAGGLIANPRQYLAEAFPEDFTTTVRAGSLEGEILGDYRSNEMIANSRANTLEGLAGADTYSFPALLGADEIIDSDDDGKIFIGGVEIFGKAHSKRDISTDEIIPDQWTLGSFNLARVGDNLEIYQSGKSRENTALAKVVVKNYPFNSASTKTAFGINLNQHVAYLGLEQTMYDEDFFGGLVFPSTDTRGRFFAEFLKGAVYEGVNYGIKIYDTKGSEVSKLFFTNLSTNLSPQLNIYRRAHNGQGCILDSGDVVFIYTTSEISMGEFSQFVAGKSAAFVARVNSRGELVSNSMVDEVTSANQPDFDRNFYSTALLTRKGACFVRGGNKFYCGDFNAKNIALVEVDSVVPYYDVQPSTIANLPTGHRIRSVRPYIFTITSPIYAPDSPEQTAYNYDVTKSYTTNQEQKKSCCLYLETKQLI
ncbi:MAG: M23 family metallopeptidase [Proteobacteria bacterium]|nr:M23 family metallopeptidase [Pseudomonadota bacterium]